MMRELLYCPAAPGSGPYLLLLCRQLLLLQQCQQLLGIKLPCYSHSLLLQLSHLSCLLQHGKVQLCTLGRLQPAQTEGEKQEGATITVKI